MIDSLQLSTTLTFAGDIALSCKKVVGPGLNVQVLSLSLEQQMASVNAFSESLSQRHICCSCVKNMYYLWLVNCDYAHAADFVLMVDPIPTNHPLYVLIHCLRHWSIELFPLVIM